MDAIETIKEAIRANSEKDEHWVVLSDGHTTVGVHVPIRELSAPRAILRADWLQPLLEAWLLSDANLAQPPRIQVWPKAVTS